MFSTNAEFNAESCNSYGKYIDKSFRTVDIHENITSLICAHMVDFCMPR